MSEPYLKVWAADMRADPKIALLAKRDRYAPYLLIQAWDLAKNGPVFGELRHPDSTPITPSDFADLMPGLTPKEAVKVFGLWTNGDPDSALAVRLPDGALSFPKLEDRQGSNAMTAAERQRKYRERRAQKRDAKRNGSVTPDVTPSVTSERNADRHERYNTSDETLRASSRERDRDQTPEQRSTQTVGVDAAHAHPAHRSNIPDESPTLPPQLERIMSSHLIRELKPSQTRLVAAAWAADSNEIRHSLAAVEQAENSVGYLVQVAKRIVGVNTISEYEASATAERAAANSRRAGAIAACRRMWKQGLDQGDNPTALRESIDREYRHDPTIVTEALATIPSSDDVPL
jgi:hypothetical protein